MQCTKQCKKKITGIYTILFLKMLVISDASFFLYLLQLMKLMDWVMDICIQVFVKSKAVNDFFLLHGVTGLFFCIINLAQINI